MTIGGKRFYVTLINDFSIYTKLYLLRNKDEAGENFSIYENEVENQLGKRIKKIKKLIEKGSMRLICFCPL